MFKRLIALLFCAALLSGCGAQLQGVMTDIGTEKKLNNETGIQYAHDVLDTWAFRSGLIRTVLGPNTYLDDMASFMRAMDGLDKLEAKKDTLTDRELGEAAGHRLRIFNSERKAIKKRLPAIFKLIAKYL